MNLQVNLLSVDERRTPAGVALRAVVRLVAVLGVSGVLVFAFYAAWGAARAQARLASAQGEWRRLEPDLRQAEQVRAQAATSGRLCRELAAFSNAQLRLTARLHAIERVLPEQVQLTELALSQATVDATTAPARKYDLRLAGNRRGDVANADVSALIAALSDLPASMEMGRVSAGGFGMAPVQTGGEVDYVFEIRCSFEPRRFQ